MATDRDPFPCPVCADAQPRFFLSVNRRDYWRCDGCGATILDKKHFLGPADERARYALHANRIDDPEYRRFLSTLSDPLLRLLPPHSDGLDYGCGTGPALASMLQEAGHAMQMYDPFFQPDPTPLARAYDFITCTETAEHFYRPAEEFNRLNGLLRPGGVLAVMTCFQTDDHRFVNWSYRRDDTHVVFYKERTLRRIAARFGWRCDIPVKNVAFMWKG